MADRTQIEWCDATWNPITGCTPCSPGCEHCYARRMLARHLPGMGHSGDPGEVTFHSDRMEVPLHWRKPRRVFVCSMSDLFHKDVPARWVRTVFSFMARAPQHTYLLLTKRAERARSWFGLNNAFGQIPENVWLGVTACNQAEADAKIPVLLQTPAALRFASIEPMLGPVDLDRWLRVRRAGYMPALDWVICGGETGAGARPMLDWWAMAVMRQCLATSVPFFYKGAGTATMPKRDPCYKLLAGREWREFPVATR